MSKKRKAPDLSALRKLIAKGAKLKKDEPLYFDSDDGEYDVFDNNAWDDAELDNPNVEEFVLSNGVRVLYSPLGGFLYQVPPGFDVDATPIDRLWEMAKAEGILEAFDLDPEDYDDDESDATRREGTDQHYQFRLRLDTDALDVWRRFVMKDATVEELHEVIQWVLDWSDTEPFQFQLPNPGAAADAIDGASPNEILDDRLLSEVLPDPMPQESFSLQYVYGEGLLDDEESHADAWQFEVIYEGKVSPPPRGPGCERLAGQGATPLEDCMSLAEYIKLVKNLKSADPALRADAIDSLGEDFDPDRYVPPEDD